MITEIKLHTQYRNKKTGNIYCTFDFAVHSETQETLVLYRRIDQPGSAGWVRPTNLFREKFEAVEDLVIAQARNAALEEAAQAVLGIHGTEVNPYLSPGITFVDTAGVASIIRALKKDI